MSKSHSFNNDDYAALLTSHSIKNHTFGRMVESRVMLRENVLQNVSKKIIENKFKESIVKINCIEDM